VWSKAGRFVEGLHVFGGVTPAENISIINVINFYFIMYPISYMNYCLLHLNLYDINNVLLCVLFQMKCMLNLSMYVCIYAWYHCLACCWLGMLQYGIRAKAFNTKPGWAMLM
jgi:hypothetical protein